MKIDRKSRKKHFAILAWKPYHYSYFILILCFMLLFQVRIDIQRNMDLMHILLGSKMHMHNYSQ